MNIYPCHKMSSKEINIQPLHCQRCSHKWGYSGQNPYFTLCPHCRTTVRIIGGKHKMYSFRKAIWHSVDLDEIYNCTRRIKEALNTELQTDYNAPPSHGVSCSCCRKLVNESATHTTKEEKVSLGSTGQLRHTR
jgi:hypothetical protein